MTRKKPKSRVVAVSIYCTDRDRSERFYEQVLGAVLDPRDGHGCRWYRLGDLFLTLVPNAAAPSPAKLPAHAMPVLWVEVDDLRAAEQQPACPFSPIVTTGSTRTRKAGRHSRRPTGSAAFGAPASKCVPAVAARCPPAENPRASLDRARPGYGGETPKGSSQMPPIAHLDAIALGDRSGRAR